MLSATFMSSWQHLPCVVPWWVLDFGSVAILVN